MSAQMYLEYLRDEGYEPALDEDEDVSFEREGKTYLIFVDEADPEFFRLVFPNFWPIESEEERASAYRAASIATAHTKATKLYVVADNVWASVELFVGDPGDFRAVFGRCLDALDVGVQAFVAQMKKR